MKRILATACFALAAAVALAAQSYPQEQPKGKAATATDEKTVTVTGCLRAGDAPDTFILANAKQDVPAGEKPTGTTGKAAIAPESTLRLTGVPANLNLKAHVGHTVQLSGTTVAKGTSESSGAAGTPPAQPATPPATGQEKPDTQRPAASLQSFSVKSMKHVAEKCPM